MGKLPYERKKEFFLYNQIDTWQYFWGTTQQQEIDTVEEASGKLSAFEFKWNSNSKAKFPKSSTNAYPLEVKEVIHIGNYESFLLP